MISKTEFPFPVPETARGVTDHQWGLDVLDQTQFRQQVVELKDEPEDVIAQLIAGRLVQVVNSLALQYDLTDIG